MTQATRRTDRLATEESTNVLSRPLPPPIGAGGRRLAKPYHAVGNETVALDYTMEYMIEARDPDALFDLYTEVMDKDVAPDTLVGTGISGCIAIPALARRLRIEYALIRKPQDGSHSPWPIEGLLGKRWLFVDDLVSTGGTFARIYDVIDRIREARNFPTEFVGAFLYNDQRYVLPYAPCWSRYLSNYSKRGPR